MRYGLIFGSFNPIHNGHLNIANKAISENIVDKVYLIPAKQNPFKKKYKTSIFDRLRMIALAIKNNYNIFYDLIEFDNTLKFKGTYDVLKYLKKTFDKNSEFTIICGEDMYKEIPLWYKGKELLKEKFYVYPRSTNNISSTQIRELIKSGKDFRNLVPKEVYNYIKENNLYVDSTKIKGD